MPVPLHYRARHRLTHAREFDAVYAAKVRKVRGPLTVFTLPNALVHPRLGLAVGTRVGGAVVRNAWKRRIREAFRLHQHALPAHAVGHSYDLIVSVRPPVGTRPWPVAAIAKALVDLATDADREWRRRSRRDVPTSPPPPALPPAPPDA